MRNIYITSDIKNLSKFLNSDEQLCVVNRQKPINACKYFKKLMEVDIRIIGKVSNKNGISEITNLLKDAVPDELKHFSFYSLWISDMAHVCKLFCEFMNSDSIDFCLSTKRGCRRYHVDHVPFRLLITYAGKGTEYIPDEAANRKAFFNGAPNEEIIIDKNKRYYMEPWDISIFRGGKNGLLHRTPDAALNEPSLLLRLDHQKYWDYIFKQNNNSIFDLSIKNIK
ncbi:MAG: hypothetical protein CMM49_01705 [Rhodospirillaceae bacterium]|nr:hypothetical protein [Rhodospirillaceae bacterium]|tara:strand:+ start:3617 stop:4291 length:675 start_codon:yes stop_codon:yes gene_type:complete